MAVMTAADLSLHTQEMISRQTVRKKVGEHHLDFWLQTVRKVGEHHPAIAGDVIGDEQIVAADAAVLLMRRPAKANGTTCPTDRHPSRVAARPCAQIRT